MQRYYPIGTPGEPWTDTEKVTWFERCKVLRSYKDEVIQKLDRLDAPFRVEAYGALGIDPHGYPLFAAKNTSPVAGRPWALVTGGVHGYETSGVQGALAFLETVASSYLDRLNLLVVPCVSPWGYEVINRWNPLAIDPNRSFVPDSPAGQDAQGSTMLPGLPAVPKLSCAKKGTAASVPPLNGVGVLASEMNRIARVPGPAALLRFSEPALPVVSGPLPSRVGSPFTPGSA